MLTSKYIVVWKYPEPSRNMSVIKVLQKVLLSESLMLYCTKDEDRGVISRYPNSGRFSFKKVDVPWIILFLHVFENNVGENDSICFIMKYWTAVRKATLFPKHSAHPLKCETTHHGPVYVMSDTVLRDIALQISSCIKLCAEKYYY